MRRRYFLRFPVRVWPPGAAPTSVWLGGYKLTAADVAGCRGMRMWRSSIEVRFCWLFFQAFRHQRRLFRTGSYGGQFALNALTVNNGRKGGLVLAITRCVYSLPRALSFLCHHVCIRCVVTWPDIITTPLRTRTWSSSREPKGSLKQARFVIKEGTGLNQHHL